MKIKYRWEGNYLIINDRAKAHWLAFVIPAVMLFTAPILNTLGVIGCMIGGFFCKYYGG